MGRQQQHGQAAGQGRAVEFATALRLPRRQHRPRLPHAGLTEFTLLEILFLGFTSFCQ